MQVGVTLSWSLCTNYGFSSWFFGFTCADEKKKFLVGVVFGQLKARLHLLKTLFFKKERLENVCLGSYC